MSNEQIGFLKSLNYINSYELKDLIAGFTSVEVLLDFDDLKIFNKLK